MDLTKDDNSTAGNTNHRIAHQLRDAARRVDTFNDNAVDYIRENPVKCLLGALALGIVIGKLANR